MYGTAACVSILASEVANNGLMSATFVNRATGEAVPAGWRVVFQYLLFQHGPIMGVLLLCAVMGTVLTAFTGYHVWLLATNVTTNETFKWKEAEWHREGAVAKYHRALGEFRKLQEAVGAVGGAGAAPAAAPADGEEPAEVRFDPPPELVPCLEGRCAHPAHVEQYAGRKVSAWVLRRPPPMPPNAYDRGWRANVRECVFPPSMYGRPRASPAEPPVPPLAEFAAAPAKPAGAGAGGKQGGSGSTKKKAR